MSLHKRLQYSEEAMNNAIKAVENGMSPFQAHKTFNVPRTTLLDKLQGRSPKERKIGGETILTKQEETTLVNWMVHIAKCGFPATKLQLLDSVELLVKNLKRENSFKDGRPGRHWFEAFMRRHPDLTTRIPQNLSKARCDVTEEKIRNWFKEIEIFLRDNNYLDVTEIPERVFNCDESAFYLSPKIDKVLVRKGDRTTYNFINNDDKECLTTLVTCSASGCIPPPMVVYSYKRVPKNIVDKVPIEWGIGRSENGWMTGETFFEYVTNVFHPWLLRNNIPLPVILFFDGHSSHLTLALSEFASDNGIILICLLANSTHILQPLDVAVFRPLKLEWKKVTHQWRIENNGSKLGREMFAPLLEKTLDRMRNIPDIIKSGFRTCGLVPFNPNNINYAKYFKLDKTRLLLSSSTSVNSGEQLLKEPVKEFLEFLEIEINEKLNVFKSSAETWTGTREDTNLFYLWKSLKSRCENPHVTAESASSEEIVSDISENKDNGIIDITETLDTSKLIFDSSDCLILDIPSEDLSSATCDVDVIIPCNANGIEANVPITTSNEDKTNEDENNIPKHTENINDIRDVDKCSKGNDIISESKPSNLRNIVQEKETVSSNPLNPSDSTIPSPFKNSLFWPEIKKPSTVKFREKTPSVASSSHWQEYYRRKEEKKKNELIRKEQLREKRKLKQAEKDMTGKKKKPNAKVKDSEENTAEQRENAPENMRTLSLQKENYSTGKQENYMILE